MRLIDADKLKLCYTGTNGIDDKATYSSIRKMIDLQPTAYNVNKVEERLKSVSIPEDKILYASPDEFAQFVKLKDVVEIVKSGGID